MNEIKSSAIAAALADRVATITVINGFATDIGSKVFRGRLTIVPEDMPAIVMIEGEDTVQEQKNKVKARLRQSYIFEGHKTLDETLGQVDNPNDECHKIVADLKRALFGGDLTFGKLIGPTDVEYVGRTFGVREDGQALISASIEIAITYVEDLSNP